MGGTGDSRNEIRNWELGIWNSSSRDYDRRIDADVANRDRGRGGRGRHGGVRGRPGAWPGSAAEGHARAGDGHPARGARKPCRAGGRCGYGRPIVRARISITAAELPGGRVVQTTGDGSFSIPDLPAGRYTLTAARTGYVTLSYGQRRPFQSGTPLQLTESESLTGIEIRLPRGSVVTGRVFDEVGDPMPGIAVRALRYQYVQGARQLVPAGLGQSDDRGEYRIWGLNPGEYFVSAVAPPNLPENFAGRGGPPPAVVARGGLGRFC